MSRLSATQPTLVFVHGVGTNQTIWRSQLRHLNKRTPALALDLPAHGTNSARVRYTVAELATYLREWLGERQVPNPVLVGHSLGGLAALTVALQRPQILSGLIVVGAGARLRVMPAIFESLRGRYPRAVEFIDRLWFVPGTAPAIRIKATVPLSEANPEVVYCDFAACNEFDATRWVGNVDVPTLVIAGRHDQLAPVRLAEQLQDLVPHADLAVIEDAGHMAMLEQPRRFNAAVDAFVERMARPRVAARSSRLA